MFCTNCGAPLEKGRHHCHYCGFAVKPTKRSGKAIAGFVLALVGILVAAIPCGILGLVFSSLSMKEVDLPHYKGKGLATSGLVISIIDIVLGILFLTL